MSTRLGIDIGGTEIAAGVVDHEGRLLATARRATAGLDNGGILAACADLVEELGARHTIEGIGLGAAGFVDATRSRVIFAPNVPWRDEALREHLQQATGLPVVVENDANAAAWGEMRFGAAQGADNAIVITVGTGIGGGIIVNGQLIRGAGSMAGEIGHMNVKENGRRCGCGQFGCWERYGSGRALVHEARGLAEYDSTRASRLLELAGGCAGDITGFQVSQAAAEGDPAALDPEVFVLAGGVSEAGEFLRAPAVKAADRHLTAHSFRRAPKVRLATLGNSAGMIGAADLARF